jgi:hypothetical protein
MRVEFTAFAYDSTFSGSMALEADRLSDLIADEGEFHIRDVVVTALDDGRTLGAPAARISRADFAAITTTGPRGNASRRIPTRQHLIRTRFGPYQVDGYVHTPRTAHILSGPIRRRVVPLTSATIRYRSGSAEVEQTVDVLLLNGDLVGWVEPAIGSNLATDVVDARGRFARPKDMTAGFSH